jgi:hypothetical protein
MERVLNWFLRGTAWVQPSTVYLGLDSVLGDVTGGGTEISGSGYARQPISFAAFASRRISCSTGMIYTAGDNWPTVAGHRIWDAATAGNAMGWGRVSPQPTILSGQSYTVGAGQESIVCNTAARVGDWMVQRILEKSFKNTAHASLSASLKAHLALVGPANAGTGYTMVSGSGYTPQTAAFAAWASQRNYLSADITFHASAPAAWGTPVEWDLYDGTDPATDHFLFGCPLSPTFAIGIGAPVVLQATSSYVELTPDPET